MISNKIKEVLSPGILEITQKIKEREKKGKNVINLGQAVVDVLPAINNTYMEELLNNTKTHLYTHDAGDIELREKFMYFLNAKFNANIDNLNELVFTSGANNAFFSILSVILDKGDDFLIPIPYYFNHIMAVQLNEANPVLVKTENGLINRNIIEYSITNKTKGIVLVSPGNPTSLAYKETELIEILKIAKNENIWVILDETYSMLLFSGPDTFIRLRQEFDNLIIISSFSKSVPMAGWRLGYIISREDLYPLLLKVIDTISIAPPTISQLILKDMIDKMPKIYECIIEELKIRYNKLSNSIGEKIPVDGGCFVWYRLKNGLTGTEYADYLLNKRDIAVIPGKVFGDDRYIRISFGNVSKFPKNLLE